MQKYLGRYYFQTNNFMVSFGGRWKFKYINWNHDKVMRKAYRWSLMIGPIEIKRYEPSYSFDADLFDDRLVYPSDERGLFIDCEGTITDVDGLKIIVDTEFGSFDGYINGALSYRVGPEIGQIAKIRIYRQGGGSYPDHKILGWRK